MRRQLEVLTLHVPHQMLKGSSNRTTSTPLSISLARLPNACFFPWCALSVEVLRGSKSGGMYLQVSTGAGVASDAGESSESSGGGHNVDSDGDIPTEPLTHRGDVYVERPVAKIEWKSE